MRLVSLNELITMHWLNTDGCYYTLRQSFPMPVGAAAVSSDGFNLYPKMAKLGPRRLTHFGVDPFVRDFCI